MPALERSSYDPQFFAKIAKVEDRHFWFRARNRIIAAAVSGMVKDLADGYRIMEVGCGTGFVLRELARICDRGKVTGFDLYPEAVAFASERSGCRVISGDILNPPPLGKFDLIGLFDVLEHLSNEAETLNALNSLLKPHGALVLTVPAHMSLWSYFDVAACHCRRYRANSLKSVLENNGFNVEYLTEFMVCLFPLLWALRRLSGREKLSSDDIAEKASAELKVVPIVNSVLKFVLSLERFAVERRWAMPIGSSLLAIARKK